MEFPFERIAMVGGEMPDGLSFEDQTMFLNLRSLYWQYKKGIIGRDVATREKKKLIERYKNNLFMSSVLDHNIKVRNATEAAKAKYRKERTIENADILVNCLEGINL